MNGLRLKTSASVLVVSLALSMAFSGAALAGNKPKVGAVKVLEETTPSAYGKSGAQGIYFAPGDVSQADLPEMKSYGAAQDASTYAAFDELPADLKRIAKPGQCYAQLLIAPEFETYRERVLIEPERTVETVVPAKTRILVDEEVVEPARVVEEVIPAQYEERREYVMVSPPREEWSKNHGIATGAALVTPVEHRPVRYRADGTLTWPGKTPVDVRTNDDTAYYLKKGSAQTIYCLEAVPGEYKPVRRKVEIAPETVRRVEIPAKVKKVKRTVVDQEQQVVRTVVPAVYDEVEKSRQTRDPEPVWRSVLCEKNASPALIRDVQQALRQKGYDPGPIDGQLGSQTVSAMQKFQADKGLAQGQISLEAVEALGVRLP